MTDHPITPPPELIRKWLNDFHFPHEAMGLVHMHLATRATQWGADQELEACVEWVSQWCGRWPDGTQPETELRAARRPKPPSLKKQALAELEEIMDELHEATGSGFTASSIRNALEALDD